MMDGFRNHKRTINFNSFFFEPMLFLFLFSFIGTHLENKYFLSVKISFHIFLAFTL